MEERGQREEQREQGVATDRVRWRRKRADQLEDGASGRGSGYEAEEQPAKLRSTSWNDCSEK